jgi:DNA-nicking Smr family endonuclease
MGKSRQPTNEDAALFRRAIGKVRPLAHDRAQQPRAAPKARPRPLEAPPVEDSLPDSALPELPERGEAMQFVRPGLQRRLTRRLRRGQLRIEEDLDLHGLTVSGAKRALERFLAECQASGRRCVRVVHGKGAGSATGRPVIKSHVDRWLRLRPEVLAFCSALPRDGGTGAVYVLLRSARD